MSTNFFSFNRPSNSDSQPKINELETQKAELTQHINALQSKIGELETQKAELMQLIINWAHDMNMPIAGILASMSSLRDKHEPGDLVQMFREVTTGIQALSDLQKNISEYANGTPGALKIDVIETAEWIKSVVSLYRPVAAGKRIKLHEIVTELVPETIRSDRGRLTRIISNLIFNAIRFTGPDKRIVVRAYMFKGMLNIDVTDQGPGIPKDMQFDIFQAHVKLDKMSPGCGLGLSIVKANLNDIGGEIVIRSEVGKGSTFTFTVPNILY